MKLTQNKIDELNSVITLEISKEDYSESKRKKLAHQRKNAEIKGFRKGMVPASLIEKMYGQAALVESVNDVISNSLTNYIKDNNLKVLGEPLPCEGQPEVDWTDGNDFTFKFDMALNPEVNFELSKDDAIVYYNITATDEAKNEMKSNLLRQYGSLEEGTEAKEDDFIVVDLIQGETRVEGTYIALRNVAEAAKSQFVGVKAGDSREIDVNVAFENETDRAAMLKVQKSDLAEMNPVWTMNVLNVKTFVDAPMTQETFDKIFGNRRNIFCYKFFAFFSGRAHFVQNFCSKRLSSSTFASKKNAVLEPCRLFNLKTQFFYARRRTCQVKRDIFFAKRIFFVISFKINHF